jgi:peptidyl-prolyl cis-trans isomerase D
MAVISSIRKRAGLVAALIAVALFSFVLSDMFFKGKSPFASEQGVGEISGNSISIIAFDNEVQRVADMQKERRRQAALDDETMNSIRDNIWEKFIKELALKPQFQSAGIAVSDGELKELLLGNDPDPLVVQYFSDPNSSKIIDYFRDPVTGKLNTRSVKTYVDSLPAEEKGRWTEFEGLLRDTRMQNKYLTLIKQGLYVTTEQAKTEYVNLNRTVNFKYVFKPYSALPDSAVAVNDQDLLKYYNQNSYKFKQDASRKLEYLIFDIKPTQLDFDEVKNQMDKLASEWKEINTLKEDSFLVVREGDSRTFDTTHYGKGQLPLQIDSLAHAAAKGTILPLYIENNQYKLTKVLSHIMSADSVKARHILIKVPKGDSLAKARAKIKIDSIKTVILKKHNFLEMAKQFSEDAGSKDSGGALGWFTTGKMVPEFQSACFNGKKGDMPIAFSQFGYHLIEILDQSAPTLKTEVATVDRKIEPGTKTRQDVYNLAVDFVTKYHTSETFDKGVEESHLIKRLADPLKENDKAIAGIETPREIIRWAFNASKGDVSVEPFSFPDKYVVAHVAEIREEGIAPLEQKKEEVTLGARKIKKAERFIEEMNKANAKTIEEYSSKLNLQINPAEGATFTAYSLPNAGRELNLYGPVFTLKENQLSKPVAGESGVYVVKIDKITEAPPTTDYTASKVQTKNNYTYRADVEAIEAIKKKAEIKDSRAKFY